MTHTRAVTASAAAICPPINPNMAGSRRGWLWWGQTGVIPVYTHAASVASCHAAAYADTNPYRHWTLNRHARRQKVLSAHRRHARRHDTHRRRRGLAGRVVHAIHSMAANMFPYGACTWWANQRYYQLHGIFVPWRMNADASQWVTRAREAGWRVSSHPTSGSIVVMQPGVQGAYGYGHVAVVERVLAGGSVIASSMNWGGNPWAITKHQIHPGPGIAFVRQI